MKSSQKNRRNTAQTTPSAGYMTVYVPYPKLFCNYFYQYSCQTNSSIIILAIRQRAAWASTLITQNILQTRNHRKQRKATNNAQGLSTFRVYFPLYIPYLRYSTVVFAPPYSLLSILKSWAAPYVTGKIFWFYSSTCVRYVPQVGNSTSAVVHQFQDRPVWRHGRYGIMPVKWRSNPWTPIWHK